MAKGRLVRLSPDISDADLDLIYPTMYYSNDPTFRGAPASCAKCKTSEPESQEFLRCSSCKAVKYCTEKCQMDDWKGVELRRIAGENSHKRSCPWYKKAMDQWPEVTAIQKIFPWSANMKSAREKAWITGQIELLLGLKGEDTGYWRGPRGQGAHDAERTLSKEYLCHGLMFLQTKLPSHEASWLLPLEQIPLLSFDDPASKSIIPVLHNDNTVQDWISWYEWRKLPLESPVALRMDMVLTVYHLLTKVLGVVDTSENAAKSRRKLVIHFAGAEKELNIIPLFSELALLIPNTDITLMFFGGACKKLYDLAKSSQYRGCLASKDTIYNYSAPSSLGGSILRVRLGKTDLYELGERPDAVIGENAGLFAYMTWQMVYTTCAQEGIPFGVTEYQMREVVEYEGHMWQWANNARISAQVSARMKGSEASPQETERKMANASRAQAKGAAMNPFMRPGLMESESGTPRAYNGFVLRVC